MRLRGRSRSALRLRGGGDDVDESLYSRQLYVMGHAAQRSLASAAVLLLGLSGLGAEVSKNLVLAGVASLDVHDPAPAVWADLSSSWLVRGPEVGARRAGGAAGGRLGALNDHVAVRVLGDDGGSLGESPQGHSPGGGGGGEWWGEPGALQKYGVVVACDMEYPSLRRLAAAARAAGAKLVACWSSGVFGGVFCDFGDDFVARRCGGGGAPNAARRAAAAGAWAVLATRPVALSLPGCPPVSATSVGSVCALPSGHRYTCCQFHALPRQAPEVCPDGPVCWRQPRSLDAPSVCCSLLPCPWDTPRELCLLGCPLPYRRGLVRC